jgi:hypothetical protein
MRFATLIALVACSGPVSPLYIKGADTERVQRAPANAPPDPIGTTRPGDRSCTENRDCKMGDACFAPDFTPPAAAPRCQQDTQCPNGQVCSGTSCASPCTPTSCGPGQECRDGGHCAPIACTDARATICPQNFRCNPTSGACERQACTSRAQCDAGACFHGRCFAHDAYCMPQNYCCPP